MKLPKLTAFTLLLSVFFVLSCEPEAELKRARDYEKQGIILSAAQQTPPVSSSALGKMDVFYSKGTKLLNYSVNWSGLSGAVTGITINGVGPSGFPAAPVQTISTSALIKCPASSTTACGSYSGTLLADEQVVKENNIINGFYYITLRTAAFPNGELRGQVVFQ